MRERGTGGARGAGPAETAGDGLLERVLSAETAGHALDFDDTYLAGRPGSNCGLEECLQ